MITTRRHFIAAASLAFVQRQTRALAAEAPLIESIEKIVVPAPTVKGGTWFHPRVCMVGKKAFMTTQHVCGVLCSFDGKQLTIKKTGPELTNPKGRGLLEPSLTQFKDRFYLTIRAEDNHGYVAVSDDGLNYEPKQAWAWDDGDPLAMSTTQQHWLTHSDALFLVYTRKDATNTGVPRWRAPLWVSQVDPKTLRIIRATERVVLPLVGDGVNKADLVPMMGNFGVANVSPTESWVTDGSWCPKTGNSGELQLARIKWSKPNGLVSNS